MPDLDLAVPDRPTSVPDPNNKQDITIDLPLYETSPTAQVTGRSKAAVYLIIRRAFSLSGEPFLRLRIWERA
jgi:hypothetical protein